MRRRISIFGSTGSIGQSTVDLIARAPEDYAVEVLTGGRNAPLMARQIALLKPKHVVMQDADAAAALLALCPEAAIAYGAEALLEAAERPCDWAMSAIIGYAGVEVSLVLARHARVLALANKESLVCAGPLLRAACAAHGTTLLPVDSEHSAIFQALTGESRAAVERLILTASGGPFWRMTRDEMAQVTPEQAAAHPNWEMGLRISIDSASMFNKAMEMIEAHALFDVRSEQIDVLVHPQSIIHSLVEFVDGVQMAQLSLPDMRGAIGYALHYPQRAALPVARLDLAAIGQLGFHAPDAARFPALRLAHDVIAAGGLAGAAFNAAKEAALDLFLARKIGFLQMAELVEATLDVLDLTRPAPQITLDEIREMDGAAREVLRQKARLNV